MASKDCTKEFYGTTAVGEKGQIVIPIEARKKMKVEKGDKLLVFGVDHETLVITKLSKLKEYASHLSKKLETLQSIVKKSK